MNKKSTSKISNKPKYVIFIVLGIIIVELFVWRTELLKSLGLIEQANIMEIKAPEGISGRSGRKAGTKTVINWIPAGGVPGKKTCEFKWTTLSHVCTQEILMPNTITGQTP